MSSNPLMMDYEGGDLLAGWRCLQLVVRSLPRAVFAGRAVT